MARKQAGSSSAEVARDFGVGQRTVERYWQRYQESGEVYFKQRGGYRRSAIEDHKEQLIEWVEAEPGLTLSQIQQRLKEHCGVSLAISGLWRHLKLLGYTFKKNAQGQRTRSR